MANGQEGEVLPVPCCPKETAMRLPSLAGVTKTSKRKKRALPAAGGLNVHPYTVALSLGKQIRFSAPLEQIAAELEAATRKGLPQGVDPAYATSHPAR